MRLFSVITATRDRPEDLRRAIASVLRQEIGDFEMIVADDASRDDSAARVAAEFRDARVRILRLESPRGPAGARNAAIAEAKGRFLAILDDDDLMLPCRLRLTEEAFGRRPDSVLVAGAYEAIDSEGSRIAVVRPPTDERRLRRILPLHNPICHSTTTIRAETMRAIGGYREALRYSHDYDMILRAAERGGIEVLRTPIGAYRFHARNISTARCFLQGAYSRAAQLCAERRANGEAEELENLVAGIDAEALGADPERAAARVHYQIGEWIFRDGRAREARPHLRRALRKEPFRPLCLLLTIAAYAPDWARNLLGPLVRPIVGLRYPSWR